MQRVKTIAGKEFTFEDVKRIPKMPWEDQFDSLKEDYEDLDWIHVTTNYITISYTKKKGA